MVFVYHKLVSTMQEPWPVSVVFWLLWPSIMCFLQLMLFIYFGAKTEQHNDVCCHFHTSWAAIASIALAVEMNGNANLSLSPGL